MAGRVRHGLRKQHDERGETLIELLVAMVILGVAVVAVVGAFGTGITLSDVHRKQASAGAAVRDYAEQVQNYVAGSGFTACAGPAGYSPATVGFTPPSGYAASVSTVQYWTGSAWSASCGGGDHGLQLLTLSVGSGDGRAVEQLTIAVRKPCGTGSTC